MSRDIKCFEWAELSAVSIDRECLVGRRDLCDSGAAADGFQSGFRLGSNPFPRCGHERAFTYNYVKSHPKHAALHDLSATQSEAARSECVVLSELALHDLLSSGSNKVWYATSLPDMEALCRTDQQFSYDACSVKYGFWKRSATKTDISPIPRCEANPREGRRRNPTNWTYTTVPTPTNTRHGYTGHEHLDKFTLINMNGRVYDPVIGRFLSPDPYIHHPYYSQNYDRYSYVFNNPLKYTDPSGYRDKPLYRRDHQWVRRFNSVLNEVFGGGEYSLDDALNSPYWQLMSGVANGFAEETTGGAGGGAPLGGSAASGPGTGGGGGAAPLNLGGDDNGLAGPQRNKKGPFITLIDFTGLQRLFKGTANVIPLRFGLKQISINWETDQWEKIVDLQQATGFFSYTSSNDYQLSIHYGAGFQGTVVQYSKNGRFGALAHHFDNSGQAMDYLNRPVDRYIQSGSSGDNFQIFFPSNMFYEVDIYEKRRKTHHFKFPIPWIQRG